MPKTSCKAEMKFIDVTALADATVSATQPQEVSNMELFGEEAETEQEKYGTLELNQFVLDGSGCFGWDSHTDACGQWEYIDQRGTFQR